MSKQIKVVAVLLIFLAAFSGTANAFEAPAQMVRVLVDSEVGPYIRTTGLTVGDVLKEQNIVLDKHDAVKPELTEEVKDLMTIRVTNSVTVLIRVDNCGEEDLIKYETAPSTYSELVRAYEKATGITYIYDYNEWHKHIANGTLINLTSQKTETVEAKEPIPFTTISIEDPQKEKGVKTVVTAGVAGERTMLTKIQYTGGVEISRELVDTLVSISPVDEVISTGTKPPAAVKKTVIEEKKPTAEEKKPVAEEKKPAAEEKKTSSGNRKVIGKHEFTYVDEMVMTATAYTNDYESTGKSPGHPYFGITATGMKSRVGVIAVDPRVIPLHSELYVEGYGYCIAGDTGGAIKGNKIDLFFNTAKECEVFGRRPKKVYVIKYASREQSKKYVRE